MGKNKKDPTFLEGIDKAEVVITEKENRKKPDWYLKTVRRFSSYNQDLVRLENLEEEYKVLFPSQTSVITAVPGCPSGFTGDQTGSLVGVRCEMERNISLLHIRIKQVERVLEAICKMGRGLIRLKYIEGYMKDWEICGQLNMSERSYYRFKDKLVIEAAKMFGYLK